MKTFKIFWFDTENQKRFSSHEEGTVKARNEIDALKKWHINLNAIRDTWSANQTYEAENILTS